MAILFEKWLNIKDIKDLVLRIVYTVKTFVDSYDGSGKSMPLV